MFKILKIFLKSYRGNFSDDETWNGGVEVVGKKLTQTMFGLHDHCCNQRCSVSHSYTWMVQNIQTNFTEQMFGLEAGNCEIVTRKLSSAVLRVTVFLSHWPQDCPCQPGTQLLHSADITDWRGGERGGGNTSPGPFFVPLLLSFTSQLQLFKYLNNFYTGLEQSFSSFSVCLIINHQHHHASLSFSLLFIIRINLI